MSSSIPLIQQVFNKLKSHDLNPYFLGQHRGMCNTPMTVIKEGVQIPTLGTNRTGQKIIDIIVFVPLSSYVALDTYMKNVRVALKELAYLKKTGSETPAVTDDEKEAYTTSIEYIILKKLEE